MPANTNPVTAELLSWHGHSGGGVHVPFQQRSNPLGKTIKTNIVLKLRDLAHQIATSNTSQPRVIFLVGGPGNGKSETVQDSLLAIDEELGLGGELCDVLRAKFTPNPKLPRKVEVIPSDLAIGQEKFKEYVGRLILVQDATATESITGNAARELVDDLELLKSLNTHPAPVFVACVNRGLLARALTEASKKASLKNTKDIIEKVIRASSLGQDALVGRPSCWPLDESPEIACWPLDVESLLVAPQGGLSPYDQILNQATESEKWEVKGRCADCNSRKYCPFRQNAEWLREPETKINFAKVLRYGELTKGQRWNFRDALSLTAECIIGQWSDFVGDKSPCDWVHKVASQVSLSASGIKAVVSFVRHLYPQALFRDTLFEKLAENLRDHCHIDAIKHKFTNGLSIALQQKDESSSKPIREILARDYSRLDPGVHGASEVQLLRKIEDDFCQSVKLGKSNLPPPVLAQIESLLMDMIIEAELEWDVMGRDHKDAIRAVGTFRQIGAILAKRSIGIRSGITSLGDIIADYENSIRDKSKLSVIRESLLQLLGENHFKFNLIETYGQPRGETSPAISLESDRPRVRTFAAPDPNDSTPGHDMPSVRVGDLDSRIPLTFDFYRALRLRSEGCAGSSLPASVRSSLDSIRHKYAGTQCRQPADFVDGKAKILLHNNAEITLQEETGPPVIT